MVKMQFDVDEELYFKLSAIKGTRRTWAEFLREELIENNCRE